MTLPLRGLVAAGCLFILAACGGGGGGGASNGGGGGGISPPPSAPNYVGSTTPADLSSTSVAPPLTGWLLLELGLSDGVNSGIAVAKPSHLSMQQRFGKARQRSIAVASKATINAVANEACGVSGSTEINDNGLREDGTGVVVFTFRDCAEGDGTTLNGVMRVTVAAFDFIRLEPSDYVISYENIRIAAGSDVIEAGGTQHVVVTGSVTTSTRNTVARYLPENVYIRLQDFVEVETQTVASSGVSFRGRFYQSQYGYVDVQTPVTLAVDSFRGYAYGGRMLLAATPGPARAELRFREDMTLTLSIDANADGVAERGLSASPLELLQPALNFMPMADAGPDLTVDEGEPVTLDASASLDWEGAPLTYVWSVAVAPFNVGAFPSVTGARYTFTPPLPGTYVLQLTVNDGSGRIALDRMVLVARDLPAPVANAGPDQATLERSTVTLDASRTTHVSGAPDALQFAWTRTMAPANSNAAATLTGVRPQVEIDLPGTYEYRVTVTGRGGSSTDFVRITADRIVAASPGIFHIGPSTLPAQATFEMPIRVHWTYTGAPLSLNITSDVDWLTIDTPNVTTATTSVTVRVDRDALATLANGSYEGWVRITPSGGYSQWAGAFYLHFTLPELRQASPYVVYTGQPTTVNLLGEQLHLSANRIAVNGVQAQGLGRESAYKTRVALPALPAGEYTVRATNELGIQRPGARLIVRDPPAHPDDEVTLPGRPYSVEYDPQRDVFYGVFYVENTGVFVARRFHRQANGAWQFDVIAVPNPGALTLSLGGERLLVTSRNCGVHEIDPVTLQTLASASKPSCFYEDFGFIGALAGGEVLVANTNQWSSVWTYPGFTQQYQLLPGIHTPIGVMSHDRSRMLWAESPTISAPNDLHVLDGVGGPWNAFPTSHPVSLNDPTTYLVRSNLAISGDGARFMHREDVYNENYQYAGSLQGIGGSNLSPALSRRGDRAAVYNSGTRQLRLFDVSIGNSFPSLGVIDTFAEDVYSLQLGYHPDDAAVFVWGMVNTGTQNGNPIYEYRLIVRETP